MFTRFKKPEVLSIIFFFAASGLCYGLFTARMPALKESSGITDAELGVALALLGAGSILGFACFGLISRFFSTRALVWAGFLGFAFFQILLAFAANPYVFFGCTAMMGLSVAIMDVGINTQAMFLEIKTGEFFMSAMHGSYSVGGVLGSAAGSVFAFFGLGAALNFIAVLAVFFILGIYRQRYLLDDIQPDRAEDSPKRGGTIPLFILLCGILALISYTVEGSVGEWSALFLVTCKDASHALAALCFGSFCLTMGLSRFMGDHLRARLGDHRLLVIAITLGLAGMLIALFSPWAAFSLIGYAIAGFGLAPVVPIIMSNAGQYPGITPKRAAAVVSIFAYTGLLVIPPSLGFLSGHFGLDKALLLPLFLLLIQLTLAACFFKSKKVR